MRTSHVSRNSSSEISLLLGVLFVGLALGKLFLQGRVNYGEFEIGSVSFMSHLTELTALLFIVSWFYKLKIRYNHIAAIFILFYFYAASSSLHSSLYILSAYSSAKGIMYALVGLMVAQIIAEKKLNPLATVQRFMLGLFWIGTAGAFIQGVSVVGLSNVIENGTQGGSWALTGYISVYLLAISPLHGLRQKLLHIFLIILACSFLNSVSALLSVVVALFALQILLKRFFLSAVILGVALFFGATILALLESGVISEIANKGYYELTTGSGRFDVYLFVWERIINGEIDPWGYGFMAERIFLLDQEQLPWAHTAHNSFLSLTLGLGYPGAILYLLIVGSISYRILQYDSSSHAGRAGKFIMLSLIAYGFTGQIFPGGGSILVTVAVLVDSCTPKSGFGLSRPYDSYPRRTRLLASNHQALRPIRTQVQN